MDFAKTEFRLSVKRNPDGGHSPGGVMLSWGAFASLERRRADAVASKQKESPAVAGQ